MSVRGGRRAAPRRVLRGAFHGAALVIAVVYSLLRLLALRLRGPLTLERRALWMHTSSRSALAAMGVRYRVEGTPPTHGLIATNHLSYLDIALFAAACPCFFISKVEVSRWPIFGFLGSTGGTLYVDRSSRASAARVVEEMVERLKGAIPVLVFPEGTSSDGARVLPFYATLFEPAVKAGAPITSAAIRYHAAQGSRESDLCWFGDAEFQPHLWKTLGAEPFEAVLRFGSAHIAADRRSAASQAHADVVALRHLRWG